MNKWYNFKDEYPQINETIEIDAGSGKTLYGWMESEIDNIKVQMETADVSERGQLKKDLKAIRNGEMPDKVLMLSTEYFDDSYGQMIPDDLTNMRWRAKDPEPEDTEWEEDEGEYDTN